MMMTTPSLLPRPGARRLARAGALVLPVLLPALLSACGGGGGGNESGPPDSIYASPSEVTVVGTPTTCPIGKGPTVYVFGGTPPYTLYNSAPSAMALSATRLQDSGDGFEITFTTGQCLDAIPITIQDDMGRLATVSVTAQLSQ